MLVYLYSSHSLKYMWATCGETRFTDGIDPEPARSAHRPLSPSASTNSIMKNGPGAFLMYIPDLLRMCECLNITVGGCPSKG
ncbi:hypothetical protein EXIGLDRAFT_337806 [Exidia glandulosa HHB12029]|uniref:Uncharacterized protein n=1 Tax=Exidia glandulosa HHB12029 TaxID=1314781 RepID=A0A165LJ89_EXIGL|nr:hypothetical protein EXIGLDRAFT_337806 [Exidia glandulosa HHB12029]